MGNAIHINPFHNLPKTITQGTATTAPGETTVYINPRWDTGTHYEKTTQPITGGSVTEHPAAAKTPL